MARGSGFRIGSSPNRNFGLDILRAAAILMVLFSHFYLQAEFLGFYGVELFFALSGFLIGGILLKPLTKGERFGWHALSTFWVRRWFRTLPNYYWFLLLYFIFLPPTDKNRLWSFAVFFQNFAWPIQPFATHTWSLTIEEWFYVLFPLVFLALSASAPTRDTRLRRFLYATIVFLILPTVLRFTEPLWISQPDARMIVVCRLDAIMWGVLLAYLQITGQAWPQLRKWWPLGVVGLAISGWLLSAHRYYYDALAFFVIAPSFTLMLPAFEKVKHTTTIFGLVIEKLSMWSYSIYLCHMLVYLTAMQVLDYEHAGTLARIGIKILSLTVAVVLSALNYRWFELPLTNMRDLVSQRHQRLPKP